jgi:hypothetical protein
LIIDEVESVIVVREYIRSVETLFYKVTIVERQENYGLALNIINGINHVFKHFDKIIVLEDDILVSINFIEVMNELLGRYSLNKTIFSINGFSEHNFAGNICDFYQTERMDCWGWATWSDRWCKYSKNSNAIISLSQEEKHKFNLHGSYPYYSQILSNHFLIKNTWAVFWYSTIFLNKGMCIAPTKSLTTHIGEFGTHGKSKYFVEKSAVYSGEFNFNLNNGTRYDAFIRALYFSRATILSRIFNKIKTILPLKVLGIIYRFYR